MLPNFLIIGVQKAATTWLSECLHEHYDIFLSEIKETYFFNDYFKKGLKWYEAHFDGWSGQYAIGEATPGYISHPEAAARIQATLGNIRLIASLRHPVDRAYSAFWHHLSRGRIPSNADFRTYFQHEDRVELRSRGYYYAQLSRYLARFPRQNLLVLIYEEMGKNRLKAITDCLSFLDVDAQFVPQSLHTRVNESKSVRAMQQHFWLLRQARNWLPKGIRKPLTMLAKSAVERFPKRRDFTPLSLEERQELLVYFIDDIKKTEDLLQRDLSVWYRSNHA